MAPSKKPSKVAIATLKKKPAATRPAATLKKKPAATLKKKPAAAIATLRTDHGEDIDKKQDGEVIAEVTAAADPVMKTYVRSASHLGPYGGQWQLIGWVEQWLGSTHKKKKREGHIQRRVLPSSECFHKTQTRSTLNSVQVAANQWPHVLSHGKWAEGVVSQQQQQHHP